MFSFQIAFMAEFTSLKLKLSMKKSLPWQIIYGINVNKRLKKKKLNLIKIKNKSIPISHWRNLKRLLNIRMLQICSNLNSSTWLKKRQKRWSLMLYSINLAIIFMLFTKERSDMKTKIRFLPMLESVIKLSLHITIKIELEQSTMMFSSRRNLSVLIVRLSLMLKSL